MNYLNGEYYAGMKDHRYRIHPTEKITLRKRDPPNSLRTQYQVQKETQIRRNQKVVKNKNDELVVKVYPKNKQPIIQQRKINLPSCPSCKRNIWIQFDKGYYCKNFEFIINKQKHQIDKNFRWKSHSFSTRLNYASKKFREISYSTGNFKYTSIEDMINKLQVLKSKTKLKLDKSSSNYYDNLNKRFDEDPSGKNAQGISRIYHEVILSMKFLQTKPQVKNMNFNYYDLYYTVIKNRDDKEIVNDEYENNYIYFSDIIPNHYIGKKW